MSKHNSKKRKKKRKQKNLPRKSPLHVLIEYYTPVFFLLHEGLSKIGYDCTKIHPIRRSFWQFVLPKHYYGQDAKEILKRYLGILEKELASILQKHSLSYWLHAYRRLYPGPIGQDSRPVVIGIVRAILEAAIQKYGLPVYCDGIGISNQIPENKILDGMLMQRQFADIRRHLKRHPSLVLTRFGLAEMIELYDLERLAYEVWVATANIRAIGKGASLIVVGDQNSFSGVRSDELNQLIDVYDKRNEKADLYREWGESKTGMVYSAYEDTEPKNRMVFIPTYNLTGVTYESLTEFFKKIFNIELRAQGNPNFVYAPFNLNNYLQAHEPFSEAFEKKYGVSLKSIIGLIGTISYYNFRRWFEASGEKHFHYLGRAYDGPFKKEVIYKELEELFPHSLRYSGLNIRAEDVDFHSAIKFFELDDEKKENIDLFYPGPHCIFLPVDENSVFVDCAWIFRRLYDLFVGINIPDQNFKGKALENLITKGESVLPEKECKALNKTKKQIDAAFEVNDTLVIAECKAIGTSIAYDRGDPVAIEFRRAKINDALRAVDEKAQWLADNPVGTNYDIRSFRRILPIVITPFVEFIPSLDSYYWMTDHLPRVLIPSELEVALQSQLIEEAVMTLTNTFPISQND